MNYPWLDDEQKEKYAAWYHQCDEEAGAIGGKISFIITPTSIGTFVQAKCICGEKIDLTDVDLF